MKRPLALLLLLTLACNRAAETPVAPIAPAAPVETTTDAPPPDLAGNLLDLARGASVISRSAEFSYETSAAHTIDGDGLTHWISPPGGPEQTLVYALATRTRVRRLGLTTVPSTPVQQLQVDRSLDGNAWTPVGTLPFESKPLPQMHDVAPFEAHFLRIRTLASQQYFSLISTIHVIGEELEAPRASSIDGCWTINGRPARFEQRGAQVRGVIDAREGYNETTVQIEGGYDGRTHRLAWRAGAQWGFAILTVAPDGRAVSALRWHERIDNEGAGDGWLGSRGPCATTPIEPQAVRDRLLTEYRSYPLYGLRFDAQDRLVVDPSATTLDWIAGLLSRRPLAGGSLMATGDGRPAASATNAALRLVSRSGKAQLDSLRAALAARGADTTRIAFVEAPERPFKSFAQKILQASIEIETR